MYRGVHRHARRRTPVYQPESILLDRHFCIRNERLRAESQRQLAGGLCGWKKETLPVALSIKEVRKRSGPLVKPENGYMAAFGDSKMGTTNQA